MFALLESGSKRGPFVRTGELEVSLNWQLSQETCCCWEQPSALLHLKLAEPPTRQSSGCQCTGVCVRVSLQQQVVLVALEGRAAAPVTYASCLTNTHLTLTIPKSGSTMGPVCTCQQLSWNWNVKDLWPHRDLVGALKQLSGRGTYMMASKHSICQWENNTRAIWPC